MIVFPAASTARSGGKSALCQVNSGILTRAWLLYAEDNESSIVGSSTYEWNAWQDQRYPAWAPSYYIRVRNFVGAPHDQNHGNSFVSVEDEIRGIQQGGLWPYVNNAAAYHCPSDRRYLSQAQRMVGQAGGYRSYSLGNVYNGYAYGSGWATNEYYFTVYKTGEIDMPSTKLVFLEEQSPQGFNSNTWNLYLTDSTGWRGDTLACSHSKGTTFSFADGHVERHVWMDPTTLYIFENSLIASSIQYNPGEGRDLTWFVAHYLPGKLTESQKARLPAYK
jgi:prepilin-type processing-associated H-X9-DG protein